MSTAKKTLSAKTGRKHRKTLKPLKSAGPGTSEENLKRLAKSTIPSTFVRKHKGVWNHQDWLDFLAYIQRKGYEPICHDKAGLILESCKRKYLAEQAQVF